MQIGLLFVEELEMKLNNFLTRRAMMSLGTRELALTHLRVGIIWELH